MLLLFWATQGGAPVVTQSQTGVAAFQASTLIILSTGV